MDDTCAVCAETLEWVAYGPCGHKDVCSTCIIRLRFICKDSTCCICKMVSNYVFLTKALGEYTSVVSDFGTLPENPKEGKVGNYWYHEGTGAYFDNFDHYKMVKAMCRLSCNVCDREEAHKDGKKKRNSAEFSSIEKLTGHLFHRHKLFMCSLCLESRKVFISEQKLYNRVQLSQHVKSGDSEADGSESERGGFMGHPICEFCRDPFYGDNELYLHMSTDHFTCHVCRRLNPGKYEYYSNYDNLEMHFRHQHFLCEDENCLEKKFIVFASEPEMKRHNAMEHGGHMSRSKRNAALQIPVSFQYRRGDEQDQHGRGRGRVNRFRSFDNQPMVTEGGLVRASTEAFRNTSLDNLTVSGHRERSEIELIVNPFESLTTTDPDPSSRYHHVLGIHSTTALLEDSSFPPLPSVQRNSQIKSRKLAARLRKHSLNSRASLAKIQHSNLSDGNSKQSSAVSDTGTSSSSSSCNYIQSRQTTGNNYVPPNHGSCSQAGQSIVNRLVSSNSAGSSRASSNVGDSTHCATASTFSGRGAFDKSNSDLPPSSSTQGNGERPSSRTLKAEDVQQANKALVKKIREALEFDEDKFSVFKIISGEYRQNLIGTAEYLAYVHQFGLSDHVPELAKLCPNAQKQKELIDTHNSNMKNGSNGFSSSIRSGESKSKKSSKKGKEKCEDDEISGKKNPPGEGFNGVRDADLLKNGYHSAKGKSQIMLDEQANSNSSTEPGGGGSDPLAGGGPNKDAGAGEGNKPRKKASKFLKNRVGEASNAASSGMNLDAGKVNESKKNNSVTLPVRGVWRNGGGQKLVAMTKDSRKK